MSINQRGNVGMVGEYPILIYECSNRILSLDYDAQSLHTWNLFVLDFGG